VNKNNPRKKLLNLFITYKFSKICSIKKKTALFTLQRTCSAFWSQLQQNASSQRYTMFVYLLERRICTAVGLLSSTSFAQKFISLAHFLPFLWAGGTHACRWALVTKRDPRAPTHTCINLDGRRGINFAKVWTHPRQSIMCWRVFPDLTFFLSGKRNALIFDTFLVWRALSPFIKECNIYRQKLRAKDEWGKNVLKYCARGGRTVLLLIFFNPLQYK
jgi:hypothetical protein